MKTLLLSAAAALALTAPAFAQSTAEFAAQHFAQSEDGGNGARLSAETSTGDVAYTIEHFAESRDGGDGPRVQIPASDNMVVSTSNSQSATYAAMKLDNGERGDN
jgi:hypothetical protein